MSVGAPKIPVVVAEVVELNPLIKRFRFVRTDGLPMPTFSGGAHTVVEMDDSGTRRMNPYSLMSDPTDTSGFEISVRRDDAGRGGSLYMHREVRPGLAMTVSHPVNLFGLDLRAKKHLLIAGGIGITPFMSMLRHAFKTESAHRLMLIYSNRRPEDAAFLAELQGHARQHERFQLVATMTDMGKSASTWKGETGLVDGAFLNRVTAGLPSPIFYVAGPPAMVVAMRTALGAAGIDDDDIRSEDFFGY